MSEAGAGESPQEPASGPDSPPPRGAEDAGASGADNGSSVLLVASLALAGGLAMWLVQPPVRWWPLAWAAPIPWLLLVQRPRWQCRRPYLWVYAGGVAQWLLMVNGVRHPHPALIAGWVALALYLAAYVPLFVALTRVAVHRARWPLALAAPAVWVALELVRGYFLTGLSLGLLGHAVAGRPLLIQVADFAGAYGVSFLLMAAAAAATAALPTLGESTRRTAAGWRWQAAAVAALIAAAVGYGWLRLRTPPAAPTLQAALVQGDRDVFYTFDPKINQEMYLQYRRLSLDTIGDHPDVQLIIWPESSLMSHLPEYVIDEPLVVPPGVDASDEEYQQAVQYEIQAHHARLQALAMDVARARGEPASDERELALLVSGGATHLFGSDSRQFNATLLLDERGRTTQRYYKVHPVMFGEYIPLGDVAPWIYDWTPMGRGLSRGPGPVALQAGGLTLSPSICFEITVPHLIRRQVAELRRRGEMPDVLVNPTNDGWFHGSSILDLHRDCMVFRAVENGRPVLSAANGGITAWIDHRGRVRGQLPRKTAQVLIASLGKGSGVTLYQQVGDLFALLCVGLTLLAWGIGKKRIAALRKGSASSPAESR